MWPLASEGFLPGGGKVDLSSGNQKYFSGEGVISDEILFFPLETKKNNLFCQAFYRKM